MNKNTLKCKPVLVESKVKTTLKLISNKYLLFGEFREDWLNNDEKFMQLILISLEDEKIDVGDIFYDTYSKNMGVASVNFGKVGDDTSKKVITVQSQLSLRLIQQLVDEHNNGGMKDFEIEMECPQCKEWGWVDSCRGSCNQRFLQPKLTNGFVTVVTISDMILETVDDISDDGSNPILYTEEEVKYYAERFAEYIQKEKRPIGLLIGWYKWFNQNKKNK